MSYISKAAHDVLQERARQITGEGWDRAHDDKHGPGVLATAASRYVINAVANLGYQPPHLNFGDNWPWHESWWKPTTPRRDLVKATALLIAEIERLDRAEGKAPPPK